jgi:PPP family 3-phenylpropionic acid transporter
MVEVMLFAMGARLLRLVSPLQLMMAAAMAGGLRWSVLALTTEPWILAMVQGLHALTYAAAHLGAMHLIHDRVPPALSARAQGVYSAVTSGLVPGLAMLGSGALYHRLGGLAFLPMAASALLALLPIWRLRTQEGASSPRAMC